MKPELLFDNSLKSDRLRDVLRQSIADTPMKPGDQLPSEPDLAAQYRVSRSTVREAVASLVQEGLLLRVHGRGTFVAEVKPQHKTVAVVMPYLYFSDSQLQGAGTDVIPRLMQAVEGAARRAGANILLYLDNHRHTLERENIENLILRSVDGLLLHYIGGEDNLDVVQKVHETGLPLVLIDRYIPDLPIDFVVTDNEIGAYRATRLLIANGFPRVVHVTSPDDNSALRDRREGYERAMAEDGLPAQILTVEPVGATEVGEVVTEEIRAYRLAQSLLGSIETPFAVFAADAPILAGLWRAIQDNALPHDSIAFGCFDEPFITFPKDVLSLKVIQPFAELGRLSVEIMQRRIAGNGPAEQFRVFVEPEIIVRKV